VAVPVYGGVFGPRQAERLLWRAAFGGDAAGAQKLSAKGLSGAVRSLTRPTNKRRLRGPSPTDGEGRPLAPSDAYGHDVLYWLDRMVRTNRPFEERMALVWHDWFATGDVGRQKFNLDQYKMLRKNGLGSFRTLLEKVTADPAMLIWLSGIDNHKDYPNENYGRELMELFTLGASDESGYPYSEDDVREQARALTGWRADWVDDVGYANFRFDERRHDTGQKTIFGRTGSFDWKDSCRLCLEHEAHAPYFVTRLWKHFIPDDPDAGTVNELVALYRGSGYAIRPVAEAILKHPAFYNGSSLVKPPVVQIAGLLRRRKRGIDTESWTWISNMAGMMLFEPPNVSGWDETRWLDTSTYRGRWYIAHQVARRDSEDAGDDSYDETETSDQALAKALRFWGEPTLSQSTRDALLDFCDQVVLAAPPWAQSEHRAQRQNALRMLIATAPDHQTC
jgi:uncharacterized protein (DUF1800 family)